ncbi:S1/P1 nuclease [Rhizobium sp. 16-449-1b]|uniref:S1/P1 nuclease n=1 Tax=Rhizobium sp. 16-449-1b TaxID=2819989 RepID=UPI001ADA4512|nr:S1/P1 nuclease [Rhizobium sp. 16-449-1b]MBO9198163.1 S1/P1 nuclease [Rhizobium sp. 16-449-1b]
MRFTSLVFAFLSAILVLSTSPRFALAWGDEGHEIVCQIAYLELSPSARQHVDALIAQDTQFREFAKSCTWPDHPRQRPSEHFLNVDRSAKQVDPAQPCGGAAKCVVSAIVNDTRDLAASPDGAEALRLMKSIGHWVGDVHQPMHVSYEDDRGGNKVYVTGPCDDNLHSVWDTCILNETIGPDANSVAIDLRSEVTPQDRTNWIPSDITLDALLGWADESLAISRSPDVEYCILKGDVCQYDESRVKYDNQQTRSVVVDQSYLQRQSDTVRTRLKMAGIRLGALLEKVFGENDQVVAARSLREFSLKQIVEARNTPTAPVGQRQLPTLTRTLMVPAIQPAVDARQQEVDDLTARVKELEAQIAVLKGQ